MLQQVELLIITICAVSIAWEPTKGHVKWLRNWNNRRLNHKRKLAGSGND